MKRILLFSFLTVSACAPAAYQTAIEPKGIVLEVSQNTALVCFPVAGNGNKSQACTTFSLSGGHNYKPGDAYPDPNKYSNHFHNNKNNN